MDTSLQLAMKEHKAGNFDEAARLYEFVLETNPNQVDALHLRGTIFAKQGDNLEAVRWISKALKITPSSAMFHSNMAWSLSALEELPAAKQHAEQALNLDPSLLNSRRVLATVLGKMGLLKEAAASWQQVLNAAPEDAKAHSSLGAILLEFGQMDQAVSHLRESIRIKPDSIRPYIPLAEVGSITLTEDEQSVLKTLSQDNNIPDSDRADALYARGMCYDRAAQFDEAFACFQEGSRLKDVDFDIDKHRTYINDIMQVFDAEFLASDFCGSKSQRPVFIVGMPRSGTTLTEQILASHPSAHGVGERGELRSLRSQLQQRIDSTFEFPQATKELSNDHFIEFAEECLALDRDLPESILRVVNKLPGNFQLLGLISFMYPNARIIHCRRNPLDTCLSCFFQNFQHLDYTFDLDHIGEFYILYRRLMAHWEQVLPLPIFSVDYEELTSSPEPLIRRMIEFLDLPWDDGCLNHQKNKSTVRTASKWQVRQPIHIRSVNRWRNYEKHIGGLIEQLAEFIDEQ
jgi:tetratricopeptide (TPR) repeat protein